MRAINEKNHYFELTSTVTFIPSASNNNLIGTPALPVNVLKQMEGELVDSNIQQ